MCIMTNNMPGQGPDPRENVVPPSAQRAPGGYAPAAPAPFTPEQDKTWAALAHFGGILGPLPPLIIWLAVRRRGPFVNQEGREALNVQLTAWIAMAGLGVLGVITAIIGIGFVLFALIGVIEIVVFALAIVAGARALDGRPFRYPLTWRMVR